jgi:hypothetical protein
MSDPLRPTDKPAPRRAEPIQPDRPTRGSDAQGDGKTSADRADESLDRAKTQEQAAIDNVRNDD